MDELGDWIPLDCYDYLSTRAVLTKGRTMNISDEKLTEHLQEQCAYSDLRVDI